MREVYLVRHGEAAAGPVDAARPLTQAGRVAVEHVADRLARAGTVVAEIRHSGLARAGETAGILARHLAPARGVHPVAGLAPDDDPALVAATLDAATEPVMLVGHLPHLARLLGHLVPAGAERVPFAPGTVVRLFRTAGGWEIGEATGP